MAKTIIRVPGQFKGVEYGTPLANTSDLYDDSKNQGLNTTLGDLQPKLVSGTNIKTINNQSILGEGNIEIQGGGSAGTLNTTNATAQSTSSDESLGGTVNLHKVSKTGSYNDLLDKPMQPALATVATTGNYNDLNNKPLIPDVSGKADKSEMSVTPGTGANADKTTIQLKSGTSATVLVSHQDISGKQDVINDLSTIRSGAASGATAQQPATTLAGYGITDAYTKTEVNGLVSTPHQEYETVEATSQTTAATDVLPASGQAADTIYRVSNWDGSANSGTGAFDVTKYSEYAWDDVSTPNKYVFLCVKSQIGEVFDISVYNNNAKYADLAAALNGGANIPQLLQKGGMSVKFVQSSDNKYVQYRLMSNTFNTTPSSWQGVDDDPAAGSENLVKSGGVYALISPLDIEVNGKVLINNETFTGDSNPSFLFDEVPVAADAVLNIDGTISAISYCVFYHDNENVGLIDSYQNAEVTIPATANKFTVFCRSEMSLDITVSLRQKSELDKINDTILDAKEIKAGTVDSSIVTQTITSTANVWFQKTPRLSHIDKIRFLAKTGTTYFFTVDTRTTPATITQIKEVVSSSEENNTVKEFNMILDLEPGVYIGFNGDICYRSSYVDGFCGAYCNPDGTNMSADVDFICGFEIVSSVKKVVSNNTETINDIAHSITGLEGELTNLENDLTNLEEDLTSKETIGADLSSPFSASTNNTTYIFGIATPSVSGNAVKINFKAKAGTVNFYKIHAETIATGQPSTVTLITSCVNTSQEEGSIKSVAITETFGVNDYLGINGAFYYSNNVDPDFTSFLVITETGVLDSGFNIMTTGCNIVVEGTKYRSVPKNIIFVDSKGSGDYLTPFDAMVGLLGKDTASNPYTIVVAPGVYNMPTLPKEKFSTYCVNRYLSIVGTDKQNCILRNDNGYYNAVGSDPNNLGDNSPLKINGNVYIANLTIISTDLENASETDVEYHQSYCIHVDSGATAGSIMEVHNCRLVNNHAPCIGFGIAKDTTLKFTDCDFEADFYAPNVTYGGAIIYGHDRDGSTSTIEEHVFIKNCTFKSSNGHAFKSVNNNNALMDCVFVDNACDVPQGKGIVLGSTTSINPLSWGNSVSEMNRQ